MLMTLGNSPFAVSISTSGARCSTFACTSSRTARAYSFGIFSGWNLPELLLNQVRGELDGVGVGIRLDLSKYGSGFLSSSA